VCAEVECTHTVMVVTFQNEKRHAELNESFHEMRKKHREVLLILSSCLGIVSNYLNSGNVFRLLIVIVMFYS